MHNVLGWTYMGEDDWVTDLGELYHGPPPCDGSGLVSPPDLNDPATVGVLLDCLSNKLGRWPVALLTLVDEEMESVLNRAADLSLPLPTLGESVARMLLTVQEE